MAYDTFTAALNSAVFPFVTDFFPRTVIMPGLDQPQRVPRPALGDVEESVNPEVAKHFYCQNIMPTAEGLASVGYTSLISALGGSTDFDQAITLRDMDENNFLFSPARGRNYIYTANSGVWVAKNPFTGWTGDLVTRSYVNGRTFICYEAQNVYEYNTAAGTFLPVVLTGISGNQIDGISSSNNYNIAWSGITISWSSLIDPLDFTPSILTGAASAIPQDVKGPIRAIFPISGGFVIYTNKNAVSALYTGNARTPFIFREISNAGGVIGPEQITGDANLGYHYAWTSAGLQKVTVNGAEIVNSAATDFIAGRIIENFDLNTLLLTISRLTSDLKVKVTYISSRYLVVSYGQQTLPQIYTHAIVLDTSLKRWGKLRIDHVDCFQYPYPNIIGATPPPQTPPKRGIAFLLNTGLVQLLVMDYRDRVNQGVLFLGRFQLVRQKAMTYQSLELESLSATTPPSVYLLNSLDGKTLQSPSQLQLLKDSGTLKKYGAPLYSGSGAAPSRTGVNFSALLVGTFELNTATLTTTRHGNR